MEDPEMKTSKLFLSFLLLFITLGLAACSGGGGGGGGGGGVLTYTVGGTVSGLSGTVVLQNNGGDDLSISADGAFTFATRLNDGSAYAVTVATQPSGQSCSVSNGTGTISGASVTNVQVACGTSNYTVGGTVSGLNGSVVLQNNGGDNLTISADGPFTFASALANGSAYAVNVLTQPSAQSCTVSNGSGTIAGANITNVTVACISLSATTYRFYTEAGGGASSIDAVWVVDPANPTSPMLVDTGPIEGVSFFNINFPVMIKLYHGGYVAGTGTVNDTHVRTAMYAKNGRLYKVSALNGGGTPVPVQVSNDNVVTKICNYLTAEDFADHNNARLVYEVPGDSSCTTTSNNAWKVVSMGMGATTAPLSAKKPIGALHNATTGALTGWLVLEGTTLNKYNADFGNVQQVDTGIASTSVQYVARDGDVILRVDKGVNRFLKRYNTTTGSLTDIHNSATLSTRTASDSTYMYFADLNVVYQYPFDGSAARSALITEASGRTYSTLTTTDAAVIYRLFATGPDPTPALKAGRKSDGFISTLVSGSPTPSVIATAGNFVYYSAGGAASVIKDDGTGGGSHANAVWIGLTFDPTISFIRDLHPIHMLLANVSGGNMALQPFDSYEAASHTVAANLGTVDSDVSVLLTFQTVPGANILLTGLLTGGAPNDAFFIDAGVNGSLVRTTFTPSLNEWGCAFNPNARGSFDPVLPILVALSVMYVVRRRRTQ